MNDKEIAEYLKEALTVINKLQFMLSLAHMKSADFLGPGTRIEDTRHVNEYSKPIDNDPITHHTYHQMTASELYNHFEDANFNLKRLFENMAKPDYLRLYFNTWGINYNGRKNDDPKQTKRCAKYRLEEFKEYISTLEF